VKVRYQRADDGGCGYYRLIWPCQALADQGHDVAQARPHVEPGTDVVVIQRPLRSVWADSVIPTLHASGIAVVVEIDDDFASIDPANAAWRHCHPRLNPTSNSHHLARAAAMADLVTVTTPALAQRYGGHGRVAVIPNYVPVAYLNHDPEPEEQLMLGWTGSTLTHPGDLTVARAGIRRALDEHPRAWGFRAVGGHDTLRELGIGGQIVEWTRTLPEYAAQYARLDAAVVPLKGSAFNEAKSWLKGLEAAALGVPFVASSTGPYRQLRDLGAGLVAESPGDWPRMLRRLLSSPALREDLTLAGRAAAVGLTVEGNAWRWLDAWATARAHYEQRTAA
jgi:glycosyltransferase involved in cell wall biosynthesis